jgi:hypothetical protein
VNGPHQHGEKYSEYPSTFDTVSQDDETRGKSGRPNEATSESSKVHSKRLHRNRLETSMNRHTKTKHSEKVSLKYRRKRRSASAETTERRQSPRSKRAKRKMQTHKQVREQACKRIKMNEKGESKDDEGMWHNIISI